jgi:hypothetical protein
MDGVYDGEKHASANDARDRASSQLQGIVNLTPIFLHWIQYLIRLLSPRKWKAKLKEWSFEKHLSENEMKIVVAKVDNRKRAGKDTAVFHNGLQMPAEKIDNFKRRKIIKESGPASPSAR